MFSRLWGTIMMAVAIAGLIITTFLLVQVWRLREPVVEAASAGVNLIGSTLDTTLGALTSIQQSLDSTATQLESLDRMSQTLAQSMYDTGPLLDSLKTLTGKDLPATLQATEQQLRTAQASARVVDSALATLTRIPFLPVQPYQPDVTLDSALERMSASLDDLNPSLASINKSLDTTSGNISTLEAQTGILSTNIQSISRNVTDLKNSVTQYRQTVLTLRTQVNEIAAAVPALGTMVALVFSFVLLWLIISQVDLLVRGYVLVRASTLKNPESHKARGKRIGNLKSEEV